MKNARTFRFYLLLILSGLLLLSSCVQGTGGRKIASKSSNIKNGNGSGNSGNGSNAVDGDGTTDTTTTLSSQKVELSHLIDPFDGTYKKKLTIPKNFKGYLYLAGLNVSALADKIVYVRFNFGLDKQSIVIPATVARAPGIIPKTDIQVLVMNMNNKPFSKMRLGYDLYDYNDYAADPTKEPVVDPRDGNLYCRGLKLEDDPTFIATSTTSACATSGDQCLYAYAKVVDATLNYISGTTLVSSIPSKPQVWTEGATRNPTAQTLAPNVCLPDDSNVSSVNQLFDTAFVGLTDGLGIFTGFYKGPYRAINDSQWQITGGAIINGTYGLFETTGITSSPTGYHSLLFPRAGKLSLPQGVTYLGSTDHFGPRTKMIVDSSGISQYVDGCNLRAQYYDVSTAESISSCTVDSSIELFYYSEGKEVNITTDKTIKLQLIKPSQTNYEGKEVLTSAFKRCDSSSQCGSSECCFNNRCWSKDLVTQCVDQLPGVGNQEIGANCTSDYQCVSLCCNMGTGSCAPHNPNGSNPVSCSKSAGQACITKDFCAQEPVTTCKIVKAGFKADGTVKCDLRCYPVMTYGSCTAGTCVPPVTPPVPTFDPNDCSKAVDP